MGLDHDPQRPLVNGLEQRNAGRNPTLAGSQPHRFLGFIGQFGRDRRRIHAKEEPPLLRQIVDDFARIMRGNASVRFYQFVQAQLFHIGGLHRRVRPSTHGPG